MDDIKVRLVQVYTCIYEESGAYNRA